MDLRAQYELFPYPPVSWLALPRAGQGEGLRFEQGARLSGQPEATHDGARILVAGAGTLEALIVAGMHPNASEIVAVDLSERSLEILRRRILLSRASGLLRMRSPRGPRLRLVCADLSEWNETGFDYILASNVLHHVADPSAMLARMASWLKPDGWMRVVTYPRTSRIWMRETSRYLRGQGLSPLTPGLVVRAREAVRALPRSNPVRSCFESHPEVRTAGGLVDAFLNALENPLSPLQWRAACARAGLTLRAEAQNVTSQSHFLVELLPATSVLDTWEKLQVLDDLLELCANPVLWLQRSGPVSDIAVPAELMIGQTSNVSQEIQRSLDRVSFLLSRCGLRAQDALDALSRQVGPRVSAPPEERALPGLSILDHLDLRTR